MKFTLEPDSLRDMVGQKDTQLYNKLGGVAGVANELEVNLHSGLCRAEEIDTRAIRYGKNVLPPAERMTLWEFIKDAANDKTMLILIGAAVLSLVLGLTTPDPRTGVVEYSTGWIEGAAILVSVFIVIMVTAVNDFKKQEKFAELENTSTEHRTVTVLRNGHKTDILSEDLVVGDVIALRTGTRLTVDAILISGQGVVCDESDITGETDDVPKGDGDDFLISGTSLTEGIGYALVTAVGVSSFSGHIAMITRAKKKPTPLQEKLEHLADVIGKFGLLAASITFVILAAKETYLLWINADQKFHFMKYWEMLTTAVAIVVVAVPEGLPLSVTIALAYSMQQMLDDKNLVRHLAACETMGGATCICSDKTGTLTANEMSVIKLWTGGQHFDLARLKEAEWLRVSVGDAQNPQDATPTPADLVDIEMNRDVIKAVAETIIYSSLDESNRTALALMELVARLGYDSLVPPSSPDCKREPFCSSKKQSKTKIKQKGQSIMYVKGASEVILAQCTHWMNQSGERLPLTAEYRTVAERVLNEYASVGLRTLCIANSQGSEQDYEMDTYATLTCLALIGIEEPIRPEVEEAISQCKAAGIGVKMVTGDNLVSAVAVARRCGIVSDDYRTLDSRVMLEGKEFREMPHAIRIQRVKSIVVLARATPLDKQLLVESLKDDPLQVVAVTGDGTNDGPALKCADVGFAMNSGTEVAKAASDIILTDDNFVGVVKAVMWGRNVNDNIRKFIQFQLTVNSAACLIAIIGACMSETNLSPLKPVQLLWLNLIMDSLAALGLATELPSASLLCRDPLPKNAPIINRHMWGFIVGQGLYQLQVCLFLLTYGHEWMGVSYFDDAHLTCVFNTFVLLQVVNFFNARQLGLELNVFAEIHRSHTLMVIAVVITLFQILIVNYGGVFFGVVPVSSDQWLKALILSAGSLPVSVMIKLFLKRKRGHKSRPILWS
eukprot:TRINITY_DN1079_c0_g1_i4.p1 TRINITY_DN1079_c0_g1~~TRINITY_DN1079_c0_g1_i4.p1  ORF type:complete len:951 (+),score=218.22 TRINITY_DN1079_c0_g1_i4:1476-4328(+)